MVHFLGSSGLLHLADADDASLVSGVADATPVSRVAAFDDRPCGSKESFLFSPEQAQEVPKGVRRYAHEASHRHQLRLSPGT